MTWQQSVGFPSQLLRLAHHTLQQQTSFESKWVIVPPLPFLSLPARKLSAIRDVRRNPRLSAAELSLVAPPFAPLHARSSVRWHSFHIKPASHLPSSATFPASHYRLFPPDITCYTTTITTLSHQHRTWTRPKGFYFTVVCVLPFVHHLEWPILDNPDNPPG